MERATAKGMGLAVSPKHAIMVCAYLRGRKTAAAKRILNDVLKKRQAIPFTRFTDGVGHRKGIPAAGRYPIKASQAILGLIESAEKNAADKGLTGELKIEELRANKASTPMRFGRHSRRESKRSHVWLSLVETGEQKRAPKQPAKQSPSKDAKQPSPEQPAAKQPAKKAPSKAAKKAPAKQAKKEEPPKAEAQ